MKAETVKPFTFLQAHVGQYVLSKTQVHFFAPGRRAAKKVFVSLLPGGAAVAQLPVKELVVSSNLTRGANKRNQILISSR